MRGGAATPEDADIPTIVVWLVHVVHTQRLSRHWGWTI